MHPLKKYTLTLAALSAALLPFPPKKQEKSSLEEKVAHYHVLTKEEEKREYYAKSSTSPTSFYPSNTSFIDGKPIIKSNKYIMGEGILGLCFTQSGLIRILDGLQGEDLEKVIEHELTHREFPMWSEATVREKTGTIAYEPNVLVSYLG